jgi:hypothetical protein
MRKLRTYARRNSFLEVGLQDVSLIRGLQVGELWFDARHN